MKNKNEDVHKEGWWWWWWWRFEEGCNRVEREMHEIETAIDSFKFSFLSTFYDLTNRYIIHKILKYLQVVILSFKLVIIIH